MSQTSTASGSAARVCAPADRVRNSLLGDGVLAAPVYVAVLLAEAFTRDGFDPARHAWSLLANGRFGWIHTANLIASGLMVLAGAVGLRRALHAGRASTWAPRLLAVYGMGMVAAGCSAPTRHWASRRVRPPRARR
jgi:hypothetical membrane protein